MVTAFITAIETNQDSGHLWPEDEQGWEVERSCNKTPESLTEGIDEGFQKQGCVEDEWHFLLLQEEKGTVVTLLVLAVECPAPARS